MSDWVEFAIRQGYGTCSFGSGRLLAYTAAEKADALSLRLPGRSVIVPRSGNIDNDRRALLQALAGEYDQI